MKLVIATPLYPPEIGGPATYAKLLMEGLPSRGIEVELVKFSDVRHLPNAFRQIAYCMRVFRAARHADAILALDAVSVGWPAHFANLFLRKKLVVKIVGDHIWEQGSQRFGITGTLDEFPVFSWRWNLYLWFLRFLQFRVARGADWVIVPSPYLKKLVLAWGVPETRIRIIHNAVEIPADLSLPEKKSGEFLIVSTGRRVPWKGFEAIERVAKNHSNWRVRIVSGASRAEALGWIQVADVFVLNSSYEGFPHALVEAMSLGTPVVATAIEANRYVTGEDALLVAVGDDRALEEALCSVQEHPETARLRAERGRERMKGFSLDQMLETTAGFLKSA